MDLETGKKFVRERNYIEAEKIFINLLHKGENLILVNYFLGIIYFELQISLAFIYFSCSTLS